MGQHHSHHQLVNHIKVAPKGIENNANIRVYLLFLSHNPTGSGRVIEVLPKIICEAIADSEARSGVGRRCQYANWQGSN